jgi:hypothetical protein
MGMQTLNILELGGTVGQALTPFSKPRNGSRSTPYRNSEEEDLNIALGIAPMGAPAALDITGGGTVSLAQLTLVRDVIAVESSIDPGPEIRHQHGQVGNNDSSDDSVGRAKVVLRQQLVVFNDQRAYGKYVARVQVTFDPTVRYCGTNSEGEAVRADVSAAISGNECAPSASIQSSEEEDPGAKVVAQCRVAWDTNVLQQLRQPWPEG